MPFQPPARVAAVRSWLSLVALAIGGCVVAVACTSTSVSPNGAPSGGGCPCVVGSSGLQVTIGCGETTCATINGEVKGYSCGEDGAVDDPSACDSAGQGGSTSAGQGGSTSGGANGGFGGEVSDAGLVAPEAGAPTCDGGGACNVECKGNGCGGTIVCAPGDSCIVSCDGTSNCQGATILCNGASPCEVDCTATSSCQNATVFCSDAACDVTCTGPASCEGLKIQCGKGACSVSCGPGTTTAVEQHCVSGFACVDACM